MGSVPDADSVQPSAYPHLSITHRARAARFISVSTPSAASSRKRVAKLFVVLAQLTALIVLPNVKLTRIVKVPAFTISVLSELLARRIFRGFLTQFMLWGIMNRHYDNFSVFNQI